MQPEMQALQSLLEKAEWKSIVETQRVQNIALQRILHHAKTTVPFYKIFYNSSDDDFNALPILTRELLFNANEKMISTHLPLQHGGTYPMETSGSTGLNIRILATDATRLFYDALLLREHRWRKRDFSKCLMAIRWARKGYGDAPTGIYQDTWGRPIDSYYPTGPGVFINISSANQAQVDAIFNYKPSYLQTYPSQLAALAAFCIDNNIEIPFLVEARVTGETFTDKHKNIISQAWPQLTVSDVYSTVEVGAIAQQCPEYNNYHVNTENCLVEIVNEENNPCAIGEVGNVLLTSLLNFATPLIRYEIGDFAEWGPQCQCGRSSPVIKRIYGRSRNRLILPTGESRFPYLGERADVPDDIKDKILLFQIIQQNVNDIEVKLVVKTPLTKEQETILLSMFHSNFVYPFNIYITYHEDIPLGPNGKYEEFISKVML